MDNADVQAMVSGVDQPTQTVRKGRVRNTNTTPRVAGSVKKKKAPKPPRNPFSRSETGKLQLKRLQMGNRIESMTPRVKVLGERLALMSGRLDFITGKLKLVVDELTSRASSMKPVGEGEGEDTVVECLVVKDDASIAVGDEP
ncbi:hypothetical protein T484DRAFT_1745169 [Baffinella frigidus]|nr:hypothetical protein T484DRAFT_1745169 [Cryptophyta sp. CCMP2293]